MKPNTKSIVIIDASVENYQQLFNGVVPGVKPFLLGGDTDGIQQIGDILQKHPETDTLHIISHGSPGCLYLGNSQLSLDTLKGYESQLQQWQLDNLVLYGCNVAAGDGGEEFIRKLHRLTGAEIAASKSLTGAAVKGGNWELEVRTAQTKPSLALQVEAMASYPNTLQATIYWTDWISGSNSQVEGTITTGSSKLNVTYKNPQGIKFFLDGIGSETDYWQNGRNGRDPQTSPYTSDLVDNIPTGTDLIGLNLAGEQTLTFSETIANPVISYVSLNNNGYAFDQDFEILSVGGVNGRSPGFWGSGTSYKKVVDLGGGKLEYQLLGTGEPHGTIRFTDSFDSLSWRNLNNESWNGFTVGIEGTDNNEAPTNIDLDNKTIDENVAPNSVVGTFSTTDPDSGDSFTYTLVTGDGDTDNSAFTINGDQLQVNDSPDYETKSSYSVRVQTTDGEGASHTEQLTINVNDIIEGTPRRDTLTGTDYNDVIIGFQGRDIITGGEGEDQFVYINMRDTGDIITDFEVGSDKIVLTELFNSIGYSGSSPINDGYVSFSPQGENTVLLIDADGTGGRRASNLLKVENVNIDLFNNSDNFVF